MSKPESELPAAPGPDPRVDFRKDPDAEQPKPQDAGATDAAEPEHPAEPDASPASQTSQASAPERPADPWAPPADRPAQAAPGSSQAPPQPPPPPLPAGGWASVPPSAESGLRPGNPYANPNQRPNPHSPYARHPHAPYGPHHPYDPQPEPRTNGFAIGSLATGLSLLSPVALVFGIIALTQINRRGQRGRGMAVAGLVLGVAGTLLLSLALGAGDFGSARDGRDGGYAQKPPAGSVRWSALKAGECYNSPDVSGKTDENGDETVYWVRRVACSDPHHGEVAGSARIPDGTGPYPGATAVRERAAALCRTVLDDYALDQWAVPDGMDDVYLYPSAGNWAAGERYVTCAFEDREDQHLGTVRTDRRTLTSVQLAYLDAVRGFNAAYAEEPKKDVAVADAEYRSWARRMAAASRAEAAALRKPTAEWPTDIQSKVDKLAETQTQAATAWDDAASGSDVAGDLRRARALIAKTVPISVEIRRSLGLSTGEQVPDLRA
ncbi:MULTISPECIES: DUF4190 domain-containing protein [Kitasatospora]|uniref:DUF4190 domain-containing protein n=1 Tax=Kitasatospora cathayae TaxID=3004092 RepID=A0ABY7Q3J9_9ACTN|nr:DUF4190 domain-containing protein [Kitasatospora sp. HUAS 3-15]WBP87206.1 DUF4190 domain-containing protein [Kitasatospora sp. HUAS 3-15]